MQKDFDKWNTENWPTWQVDQLNCSNTKAVIAIATTTFGCYIPLYELLPNITHELGAGEALFGKSKFWRRDFKLSTITPEISEPCLQFGCMSGLV